ncbi:Chloroperoxidase [Auriculariales sp. MPI-PUGE-AT-0066]|nr:Chloroperoxidase [Auriculariales sp. MPI-PUGE-AT-0066]
MLAFFAIAASLGLATAASHDLGLRTKWQVPTEADSRSPCPGINTLANHGILPRNGLGVTPDMLFQAFSKTFGYNDFSSQALANLSLAFLHEDGTFELHDLAEHGKIEHDASLVHDDVLPGEKYASVATNVTKFELLKALSSDGVHFHEDDFALARHILERNLATPLTELEQGRANGEPGLILLVFGKAKKDGSLYFDLPAFESVFKFNRFPEGFTTPSVPIDISAVGASAARLDARKQELNAYGLH